jgi:hypothetical protein
LEALNTAVLLVMASCVFMGKKYEGGRPERTSGRGGRKKAMLPKNPDAMHAMIVHEDLNRSGL